MGYTHTSVEPQEYAGCPITHPSIVAGIRNMLKQGKRDDEIMRVIGMPYEVIRGYRKDMVCKLIKDGKSNDDIMRITHTALDLINKYRKEIEQKSIKEFMKD